MQAHPQSQLPSTVEAWLTYIESLHPKTIEMGLGRVQAVAKRLGLAYPFTVITVGGTNGKGSTCAMLERIYTMAGYRVGCYTSPHLVRYHERVRFNGAEVGDDVLCEAFSAVERAREEISLTYFEMGTLAALWAFEQVPLDVVILEVGLGGRLDAVNIVDADCAILTNVDLDHMEFLGDTREAIGYEKAGIFRARQVSVCGDPNPPHTVIEYAQQQGIDLKRFGVDYTIHTDPKHARYQDVAGQLAIDALRLYGQYQWHNAANVMYAVRALQHQLPVASEVLLQSIRLTEVTGRFQVWQTSPMVILDVAHNPHAARALQANLQQLRQPGDQVYAVFSMLSDKDIASVVHILRKEIDGWAIAPIHHPRAASVAHLHACIETEAPQATLEVFSELAQALNATIKKCVKNDKIVVFGSFFTVAAILEMQASHAAE